MDKILILFFEFFFYNYLVDVVLGEDMWLNFSMICFFFELWFLILLEILYLIGKFNRFIRLFLEYVGYYYNDVYGDLYIFWNFFIGFIDMKYGVVFWNFYLKYFYD